MARKLGREMTLDTLEEEVQYTIAALQADENAIDLEPSTSTWFSEIDDARVLDRSVRMAIATASAKRAMSDVKLDGEVIGYGIDLLAAVKGDRSSLRWLACFATAPYEFTRQKLSDEVAQVKLWLTEIIGDDVLEAHRSDLEKATAAVDEALELTSALRIRRNELWQKREALTASLTEQRDKLYVALVQRAQERGLARTWPGLFFQTASRSAKHDDDPDDASETATQ